MLPEYEKLFDQVDQLSDFANKLVKDGDVRRGEELVLVCAKIKQTIVDSDFFKEINTPNKTKLLKAIDSQTANYIKKYIISSNETKLKSTSTLGDRINNFIKSIFKVSSEDFERVTILEKSEDEELLKQFPKTIKSIDSIKDIPEELLGEIAKYGKAQDVLNFSLVNKITRSNSYLKKSFDEKEQSALPNHIKIFFAEYEKITSRFMLNKEDAVKTFGNIEKSYTLIKKRSLDLDGDTALKIARQLTQFTQGQSEYIGEKMDTFINNMKQKDVLYWTKVAADKGNETALLNLGCYYVEGRRGAEKSTDKAVECFMKLQNPKDGTIQSSLKKYLESNPDLRKELEKQVSESTNSKVRFEK